MGRRRKEDNGADSQELSQYAYTETSEDEHQKLKMILEVLVLKDLSIAEHDVKWEFGQKVHQIKEFEEFPYYLYKAVWDDDFEPIQWTDFEYGETILINYEKIEELLDKYCGSQHMGEYEIDHNRLRHNLVEVFGFNEIPKDNLQAYKNDENFAIFFNKIAQIGGALSGWVEYHHPDFFKNDTNLADNPKGKNSKFFKLCQTLKMPYRLRKNTTRGGNKRRRKADDFDDDCFTPPMSQPRGYVPISALPPGMPIGENFRPEMFPDFTQGLQALHAPFTNPIAGPPINRSIMDGLNIHLPNMATNERDLLIDDNLDHQSIDRALAESIDTNSVTRENESTISMSETNSNI